MKNLVLFPLCLAAGLVAGWASVHGRGGEAERTQVEPSWKSGRERPQGGQDAARVAEDLLAKALASAGKAGRAGRRSGPMADWSDAEVLAALEETAADTDSLVDPFAGLRGKLFDEYLKRNFDKAWDWFRKQDFQWRVKLAQNLATGWPEGRAEEGVRFVTENREVFTKGRWGSGVESLLGKALIGASKDGVEAFARIIRSLQEAGMEDRIGFPPEIAPGFDFATFMATKAAAGLLREPRAALLGMWFQTDREAAFRWTAEHEMKGLLGLLVEHRMKFPEKDVQWMGGRLETLTPAQRTAFLDQVETEWRADLKKDFMPLLEGATDPAVREEIRARLAQGMFIGRMTQALVPVEDIPDPEQRLHFLETLKLSPMVLTVGPVFPREEEDLMRAKLREWNATDERIEAILRKFKPSGP